MPFSILLSWYKLSLSYFDQSNIWHTVSDEMVAFGDVSILYYVTQSLTDLRIPVSEKQQTNNLMEHFLTALYFEMAALPVKVTFSLV